MRLFQMLCRRKNMPNGQIFRGKDRMVKPVTPKDKAQLRSEFEIEEQNMFYLRHPYLTTEQSSGHAVALGKREKQLLEIREIRNNAKEFRENVTIESRLSHLRFREPWD